MLGKRMGVGMGDLLFKAREGYHRLFSGKSADYWWERDLVPMGSEFIVGLWQTCFAPPPPPSK